ncbi:MAG: hypothetical protein PF503_08100, partial [Desulfobacula sp.]|nr:hypothetical protein [Desulfobacula sp.]
MKFIRTYTNFISQCGRYNYFIFKVIIVYPQIRFAYPKSIAPTNEKDTYSIKMRCLTNVQTAAMAGKVVVGPAIRKA